ncbi:MAG: GNAT family N-acetyltransferase [Bifidobacteriaceae bacterium]|nr:GNAT family N-acetyltransferase [Bifidobacteriaceae bacterium]
MTRARRNERAGASRVFVVTETGSSQVVGYYALAASSVDAAASPGAIRRNMPRVIPVILLGRLAVDRRWQGLGLGASLLQDAILRVAKAARHAGVRAMLVHASGPEAERFYAHSGFIASDFDRSTLFLPMKTIRARLEAAGLAEASAPE